MSRKSGSYLFCEIDHHIFTGRLVIGKDHLVPPVAEFSCKLQMWGITVEDSRMVKRFHNFFLDNGFEVAKINNHPQFNMRTICYRTADNGNGKLIAVPMHIPAFTIVSI